MAESRKSLASKFQHASQKKTDLSQRKSGVKDSESGSPGRAGKHTQSPHRSVGLKDVTETTKKTQSPHRKAGVKGKELLQLERETEKKSQSPHRKTSARETDSAKKTLSPHRRLGTKDTDSSAAKKTQSPHRRCSSKDTEGTDVKRSVQSKLPKESESLVTKTDTHELGKVRPSSQSQKGQPPPYTSIAGLEKKSSTKKALGLATSSDPPTNPADSDTPPFPDLQPSGPPQGCAQSVVSSDAAQEVTSATPLSAPHPLSESVSAPPAPTVAVGLSTVEPATNTNQDNETISLCSSQLSSKDTPNPIFTSDNVLVGRKSDLTIPPPPPPQVPPQTLSSSLNISEIRIELDRQAAASEDSDSDSASSDGAGTVKEVEHSGSQRALMEQTQNTERETRPLFELSGEWIERDVFEDVIEEECEGAEGSGGESDMREIADSLLITQRLDLSDITKDPSDVRSSSKESSVLSSPQSTSPSPRLLSREHSLTSTPIRKRPVLHRRSLVRSLNLSQETACEDEELSLSSSEFSNSSLDIKNRVDELSDDGSVGDGRIKETPEFTDEQPDARFLLEMPVPINKQLRIVTSVDRALNPRRRSSSLSSKPDRVLCLGRSSSENLEHVVFLDFLKKHGMSAYLGCFPPSMTMADFR